MAMSMAMATKVSLHRNNNHERGRGSIHDGDRARRDSVRCKGVATLANNEIIPIPDRTYYLKWVNIWHT